MDCKFEIIEDQCNCGKVDMTHVKCIVHDVNFSGSGGAVDMVLHMQGKKTKSQAEHDEFMEKLEVEVEKAKQAVRDNPELMEQIEEHRQKLTALGVIPE